jgi:hypothetical protein
MNTIPSEREGHKLHNIDGVRNFLLTPYNMSKENSINPLSHGLVTL